MKPNTWTVQQKAFVQNNINKLSIEQLARKVGKSENAVRLFIHRQRIQYKPAVKKNLVIELLQTVFINPEYFKPTREFYDAVGMTQMRFWKLYRGEAPPTENEYKALIEHFGASKEVGFENRQLGLFNT